MKMHRILLAAIALAALLPMGGSAQQATIVRYASKGMLGIMTEGVGGNAITSRQRVITDVVPGSPAAKAGLAKGDTIMRINGLAASQQVMNSPFEPGDTVVLRLRRNGREREVRVVAAERTGQLMAATSVRGGTLLPTMIDERVSIIMDSVRSMRLRGAGDSVIVVGDSINVIIRERGGLMHLDSIRMFARTPLMASSIHPDSMVRFIERHAVAVGGRTEFLMIDSLAMLRPGELFESTVRVGLRAVAGAELQELNPGLAQYFGTDKGVLVLNARDGTPASRAGLRSGDVILRANGTDVRSITELRRAIDGARPGSAVQLRVLRRGQNVDVTVNRE